MDSPTKQMRVNMMSSRIYQNNILLLYQKHIIYQKNELHRQGSLYQSK